MNSILAFTDATNRAEPPVTTLRLLPDRYPTDCAIPFALTGLVDTGADRCLLPAAAALHLGLDLAACQHYYIATAGGRTLVARRTCTVEIFGYVVRTEVDFTSVDYGTLIGRSALDLATDIVAMNCSRIFTAYPRQAFSASFEGAEPFLDPHLFDHAVERLAQARAAVTASGTLPRVLPPRTADDQRLAQQLEHLVAVVDVLTVGDVDWVDARAISIAAIDAYNGVYPASPAKARRDDLDAAWTLLRQHLGRIDDPQLRTICHRWVLDTINSIERVHLR